MKNIITTVAFLASLATANGALYEFNFLGGAMDSFEVVPSTLSPANGVENFGNTGGNSFNYDDVSNILSIGRVEFMGLLGGATFATVNNAVAGANGPVQGNIPLTVTPVGPFAHNGQINSVTQTYTLTASQETELLANRFYMLLSSGPAQEGNPNINGYPAGEIRGQLLAIPVPEASTYGAIAFLGVAATVAFRRRATR